MKLITAIIREEKINQVRQALVEAEITGITVSRVSGHGHQVKNHIYRGQKIAPNLIPKVRLDIAVNDALKDITIETIINAAISEEEGQVGDGKIFVTNLEECVRIRTREKGNKAI